MASFSTFPTVLHLHYCPSQMKFSKHIFIPKFVIDTINSWIAFHSIQLLFPINPLLVSKHLSTYWCTHSVSSLSDLSLNFKRVGKFHHLNQRDSRVKSTINRTKAPESKSERKHPTDQSPGWSNDRSISQAASQPASHSVSHWFIQSVRPLVSQSVFQSPQSPPNSQPTNLPNNLLTNQQTRKSTYQWKLITSNFKAEPVWCCVIVLSSHG